MDFRVRRRVGRAFLRSPLKSPRAALDEEVAGAIAAYRKADNRRTEAARDLKAELRAAVRDGRVTRKESDAIHQTFDLE